MGILFNRFINKSPLNWWWDPGEWLPQRASTGKRDICLKRTLTLSYTSNNHQLLLSSLMFLPTPFSSLSILSPLSLLFPDLFLIPPLVFLFSLSLPSLPFLLLPCPHRSLSLSCPPTFPYSSPYIVPSLLPFLSFPQQSLPLLSLSHQNIDDKHSAAGRRKRFKLP